MNRLIELHQSFDQSPWLDNLRRGWITSGQLSRWLDLGVRGITSNPTIFAKAMMETDDYDTDLARLVGDGLSTRETYWSLAEADITAALDLLAPLHVASHGKDGFVSIEVDPGLAHDADATIEAARDLAGRIARPNLYVKVPATPNGLQAIETLTGEGISINVTLIFSLDRYAKVMEAYLSGLEARSEPDLNSISSVASFFVSRLDVEIDKRLDEIGSPDALAMKGKAAVALARLAYQMFTQNFSGERWSELEARGARPQRPLWASTSTKNPDYPDTVYIDSLIGPNTVNTIPDATIEAFLDHGNPARTIDTDVDQAKQIIDRLGDLDIDTEDVAQTLEDQGVAAFIASFDDVLASLETRANEFRR